ncbi:MAG: FAD-dependent monooxygenase [Deltaproteobacteria bacterium]|nr:FAD-dependent monooxygenase [Deltaproteobacteria bacterium]
MQTALIVGAGPVGLTLACELARYGISVRIIDTAAQRTDKSKALIIWSRTLELLDRGGASAPFIDAGFKALAVNMIAGEKAVGHVSLHNIQTPYPFGLMLPQSETERLLDLRLQSFGISIERQVELLSFTNSPHGIEAVLQRADGHQETLSAGWLLGCDGAHSTVRHSLGAPFTGETNKSDWLLADVHMTGYRRPDSEASIHWHRDGVLVIFPICPGRYRVLADLPPAGTERPPTPTLEQVQTILDTRGPGGQNVFDPIWLAGFRINGRKVSEYRWGRVFLLGDAAHIHSPAGGQGMNTGMQDAFNLAWKLALVIRGVCKEELLNSYTPERSGVGDKVLKFTGRITTIGTLRNPIAQKLRNTLAHFLLSKSLVQKRFAENLTELAVAYPCSPLNGSSLSGDSLKPGARVAPVARQAPIGSGSIPRFALFAERTPQVADLLKQFEELLDPNLRPAMSAKALHLVRPDGYLACSASSTTPIGNYLSKLLK